MLSDQPHKAWEAEHLAMLVVGLHDAVAVEENNLTWSQPDLFLLVMHTWHQAEGHAGGTQFGDFSGSMPVVGQVVARVGELELPAVGIKERI